MSVALFLIIGAAAGFVATRLMKVDTGVLQTIAIGVLGAAIGGIVLRAIITIGGVAFGFVGAVVGAIALIFAYRMLTKR